MKFGTGQSIKRSEDVRFVTGHGQYTDDIHLPGTAAGYVVRSPHAHAKLGAIDASEALKMPGVLAVVTAKDLDAAGVGPLQSMGAIPEGDGVPLELPKTPQPVLAKDRVRYAGAPVAFVVAETLAQARDAAEAVSVDYDPLPAVGTMDAALAPGAPLVWDEVPGNLVFDWKAGDKEATDAAFAKAAFVAEATTHQNRVIALSMEGRAALGQYDPDKDEFILHASSQGANSVQATVAAILGIAPEKLRVMTTDVGGGFGMKIFTYPEYALVCVAARLLGRPVKWTSDRSESFLADCHGRDVDGKARLALDKDGKILALDVDSFSNLGAFQHQFGPFIQAGAAAVWGGAYKVPAVSGRVRGVYTNTMGVDAYRGAGRPESAYMMERLMTEAARVTGLSVEEIHRRNFVQPGDMPYTNWRGTLFDSGDFARNLDDDTKLADLAGFEARRAEARKSGKLRGIGLAYYIEIAGFGGDRSEIRFTDNGGVQLIVGTQSTGQGHETTYAQFLSEELGIPYESISIVQGDTGIVPSGGGTGGSRSAIVTSASTRNAAVEVVKKGTRVASMLMQTAPDDITFDKSGEVGVFRSKSSERTIGLAEVAVAALKSDLPADLKEELGPHGIGAAGTYMVSSSSIPNGCHICEVEIDEATGVTKTVGYWVVDDFGKIINPMVVEGQVHGGVAQGLGQVLLEEALYDAETGQLMTGSFMDYAMPRAEDMPPVTFRFNEVPAKTNPFGIKGCGEAGTVGALASITNAVIDALRDYGVTDIEMPATPEKVWRLIQSGKKAA
jgi:carbon-monoxide dehydrogenase large subunit